MLYGQQFMCYIHRINFQSIYQWPRICRYLCVEEICIKTHFSLCLVLPHSSGPRHLWPLLLRYCLVNLKTSNSLWSCGIHFFLPLKLKSSCQRWFYSDILWQGSWQTQDLIYTSSRQQCPIKAVFMTNGKVIHTRPTCWLLGERLCTDSLKLSTLAARLDVLTGMDHVYSFMN